MMGTSSFIQWYQTYIYVCFTALVFNHNKVNVFYEDLLYSNDFGLVGCITTSLQEALSIYLLLSLIHI